MSNLPGQELSSSSTGDLARTVASSVRQNPLAAALLGAGVIWVLGRDLAKAYKGATLFRSGDAPTPRDARDTFAGSVGSLQRMANIFMEQPLAIGIVGLTIGGGVASLIPVTDVEKNMLGRYSSDIAEQGKNLVKDHFIAGMMAPETHSVR